jgi:hypothetical protein
LAINQFDTLVVSVEPEEFVSGQQTCGRIHGGPLFSSRQFTTHEIFIAIAVGNP